MGEWAQGPQGPADGDGGGEVGSLVTWLKTAIPAPRGLLVQQPQDPVFHSEQCGTFLSTREGWQTATQGVKSLLTQKVSPAWGLHTSVIGHMTTHSSCGQGQKCGDADA